MSWIAGGEFDAGARSAWGIEEQECRGILARHVAMVLGCHFSKCEGEDSQEALDTESSRMLYQGLDDCPGFTDKEIGQGQRINVLSEICWASSPPLLWG